jgi:hypothetical protein
MLKPFDSALMRRHEASSRVNLVKNTPRAGGWAGMTCWGYFSLEGLNKS